MRHYIAQVDQLQVVTRTSAEIELEFTGLEELREAYGDGALSQIKPWSRRTALDPTGTMRIDPIKRVEVTLDHARSRHLAMLRARQTTTAALHEIILQVDARIKQKDEVRLWTKAALERASLAILYC